MIPNNSMAHSIYPIYSVYVNENHRKCCRTLSIAVIRHDTRFAEDRVGFIDSTTAFNKLFGVDELFDPSGSESLVHSTSDSDFINLLVRISG